MHFKCSSAKWRPFWLGLNLLIICQWHRVIIKRTTGLHAKIDHSNGFPRWQLYSWNRKCFRVSHMDNWSYIGNTFGKSTYRSLALGSEVHRLRCSGSLKMMSICFRVTIIHCSKIFSLFFRKATYIKLSVFWERICSFWRLSFGWQWCCEFIIIWRHSNPQFRIQN